MKQYEETMVSIVVPIFNASKYLKRCLDSIAGQDHECFEVLIVDDGSTDDSAEICQTYCSSDKRFKYIYQNNAGPDIARKTGTASATGEYLMYVDADDYIAPNMLSRLYEVAGKTGADIVCSQIVRFDDRKEWLGSVSVEDLTTITEESEKINAFFESGILIGTYYGKLIRRVVIQDYEFIKDGYIGEDITAALYMFDKASSIVIIPDRLYYYFQNDNSISHAKYTFRHAVSLNNYIRLRDEYVARDMNDRVRITGFFAGYQMAVATAMGRSGRYEKSTGEILRKDFKNNWTYIKSDKKTAFYMKCCILLYMYVPRIFVFMFRILYLMTGR